MWIRVAEVRELCRSMHTWSLEKGAWWRLEIYLPVKLRTALEEREPSLPESKPIHVIARHIKLLLWRLGS